MGERDGAEASSIAASDRALDAARAGEPWALTQLWVEYSPAVAAFLNARGSSEPDDVTSEVFLAAFERLPEFRGDAAAFRSFLFSIAYRRLVDELRRRERRGPSIELTADNDPRRDDGADVEVDRHLADERALRLLQSLPDEQADVMVLRFIVDLSVEQTAEVLGKKPGAVRALQFRAVARLRKKISPPRNAVQGSSDSRE